jgi:inositol oxygenase
MLTTHASLNIPSTTTTIAPPPPPPLPPSPPKPDTSTPFASRNPLPPSTSPQRKTVVLDQVTYGDIVPWPISRRNSADTRRPSADLRSLGGVGNIIQPPTASGDSSGPFIGGLYINDPNIALISANNTNTNTGGPAIPPIKTSVDHATSTEAATIANATANDILRTIATTSKAAAAAAGGGGGVIGGTPRLPPLLVSNGTSPPITGDNTPAASMSRSSTSGSLGGLAPNDAMLVAPRRSVDNASTGGGSGGSHLSEGHAAEELFYRLNHARQTLDFVKRQASAFSNLNKAKMSVWDALERLNQLREYEAALLKGTPENGGAAAGEGGIQLDPGMPMMEHALQTAEAFRLQYPHIEWAGLVGLLHPLGKLLAHATFGAEPQWAVCGESFPVGCRFHSSVLHSQFFSANPDRRRRTYSTPTGVYAAGCGLNGVCMSWGSAEYLYLVLLLNKVKLPKEALWLLRHQNFATLLRPGRPYNEILSDFDRSMLPMLDAFRHAKVYSKRDVPGRLYGEELVVFYNDLIAKYIPTEQLKW